MKKAFLLTAGLLLAGGAVLIVTGSASAHERRAVGEYGFVVGFLNEPAYLNQPNGLDLRVYTVDPGVDIESATSDQRHGVTGLEETLQAEVSTGGNPPMSLTIEPRFNDPGAYDGNFVPTAAGDYTFHITGDVNGTAVDESFTSSPEGFSAIAGTTDLEYPVQIMTSQDLEAAIGANSGGDDSNTMPIVLGVIGIVLGAAGLIAGGVALSRSRG